MSDALERSIDWLLERQSGQGWWTGELETNVTMTAEQVLLYRFLGIDLAPFRDGAIAHMLDCQREDGSWALYYDGPADLSTTIEAYVALKAIGFDPARPQMQRALGVIRRMGGLARARVFTKIWLALFGVYPWDGIPSLPPEMIFFPRWMPFNVYDFSCWARGTVAPLTIVVSKRPVRPLGVDVREVIDPRTEPDLHRVPGSGWMWWLDGALKIYDRFGSNPIRGAAMRAMTRWIVERQEADGSWGGIQPPWVYSLIALDLMGYALDHPVMRKGLRGFDRFIIADQAHGWRVQACMSPVWDTAWVLRALALAGFTPDHPVIRRAVRWLLDEQIPAGAPGDWRVRCDFRDGNGWAFEFDNDAYPDIDDTAVVVLALHEAGDPRNVREAVQTGTAWTRAMRSRNGAWGAFDRDNTRELLYRMPFADFGALIDPPTEDVTAHVVEMLAALGCDTRDPDVANGVAYLRATQRADGSWWGRWGVNFIYGTWCAISALGMLGEGADMIERAAAWLISKQNGDGGWGESCHSYVDESFAGVGTSTPSQTAWAVNALQVAKRGDHPAARRGLTYLKETQTPEGTWEERHFTGTGFPRDFYLNYHLYRHVFPMMALATEKRESVEFVTRETDGRALHLR
ncbi:MAG TPA: squalene--hopene cyclase [Candidatus Baltobacteraceae bacterium]|nr:squalene--hopene cyclase [Candidatus Baltobacteraceae bacterium]